jgi:hypothetical protein
MAGIIPFTLIGVPERSALSGGWEIEPYLNPPRA